MTQVLLTEDPCSNEKPESEDDEDDVELVMPDGSIEPTLKANNREAKKGNTRRKRTTSTPTENNGDPEFSDEERQMNEIRSAAPDEEAPGHSHSQIDVTDANAYRRGPNLTDENGPVSLKEAHNIFGHANKKFVKRILDLLGVGTTCLEPIPAKRSREEHLDAKVKRLTGFFTAISIKRARGGQCWLIRFRTCPLKTADPLPLTATRAFSNRARSQGSYRRQKSEGTRTFYYITDEKIP